MYSTSQQQTKELSTNIWDYFKVNLFCLIGECDRQRKQLIMYAANAGKRYQVILMSLSSYPLCSFVSMSTKTCRLIHSVLSRITNRRQECVADYYTETWVD